MNTVLRKLTGFCIALLCAGAVQAGDVEDADDALLKKDYATALRLFRAAALKNTPYAQAQLGNIYREGLGFEQDYAEAVRWNRLAALGRSQQPDRGKKDVISSALILS